MIENKENKDSLALGCSLQRFNLKKQMWPQSGSADAFSLEDVQQSLGQLTADRHSDLLNF